MSDTTPPTDPGAPVTPVEPVVPGPAPEAAWPATTTATAPVAAAGEPVEAPADEEVPAPEVNPAAVGGVGPTPVTADIAGVALPSPNTTPHDPAAAFMPQVLTPVEGQPLVAPGNPPAVGNPPAGWVEPDYSGHQIAEAYQGATAWTSPGGVTYTVDPATGVVVGPVAP